MKSIKKILTAVLAICLLISLTACKSKNDEYEKDEKLKGTHNAVITVKDYGDIKLELYGDIAPITVANFVKLVNDGFYDGLTFHRAIEDFMIQGGDPDGNGTGHSDQSIFGEFTLNGFENNLSHTRGVISMARSTDYNSASCQFFIVHGDSPHLDGGYAAFGKVTQGMEIIDQMMTDLTPAGYNGMVDADSQPIIEKIRMVD